jgi:formylglycine-generating enzyme required for sulfatase activity
MSPVHFGLHGLQPNNNFGISRKLINMNSKRTILAYAAGCVFLAGHVLGQAPVITSFQGNGILTWTNSVTNAAYRIEWTSSLGDEWRQSWQSLAYVESLTNQAFAVKVPMFYRVAMGPRTVPLGMVLVDAGRFQMGNPLTNGIWYASIEQPVHEVYVSAFWMDRYETSNEQMRRVLQWAYDHGKIFADSGTVQNLEGDRQVLVALFDSNCRIGFSNGVFYVKSNMDNFPCAEVSWYGAQAYCNYKSDTEGLQRCINFTNWTCTFTNNGYRLPTEAEWEKAARGGLVGHHFPWPSAGGDYTNHISGASANYDNSGDPFGAADVLNLLSVSPVGYYNGNQVITNASGQRLLGSDMANGYGLYDMAGNLYEWCWDWGDLDWYKNPHATDPDTRGPSVASTNYINDITRIMRGGAWEESAAELRCAARAFNNPDDTGNGIGFRSVRRY